MSFNYIETTYEPILNLSIPLDESSLEQYPIQEVMLSSEEGASIKSVLVLGHSFMYRFWRKR